jgi:hypothetical protein
MPEPVPVTTAAAALGVSPRQVRRWIADGAPVARRGRQGRGRATLVDPLAMEAWRTSQRVTLAAAAAGIPDILAGVIVRELERAEGLPKQRMAGWAAGVWYAASVAVMDELRRHDPAVGDVATVPLAVERLRKIGR